MGTFANFSGTIFASDSTLGAVAWTSASNAQFTDASYATAVLLAGQISNYLAISGFNFNIPLDAIITGVTVNVTRHSTVGATMSDDSLKLIKAGTISGSDKASGTAWGTGDSTVTYGSSSDLWGLTLLPTDVNLSTFGVGLASTTALAATADIDSILMTIDYLGSNEFCNDGNVFVVGDGMSRSEQAN